MQQWTRMNKTKVHHPRTSCLDTRCSEVRFLVWRRLLPVFPLKGFYISEILTWNLSVEFSSTDVPGTIATLPTELPADDRPAMFGAKYPGFLVADNENQPRSILKQSSRFDPSAYKPRRLSTVQDQTRYNALAGKLDNLDDMLTTAEDGLIDTSLETHKQIVQELARRVQEEPPRYAIKVVYNEFLPCLENITKHYHKIAVGASKDHPYLVDCDARLEWAREYVNKLNTLIWQFNRRSKVALRERTRGWFLGG